MTNKRGASTPNSRRLGAWFSVGWLGLLVVASSPDWLSAQTFEAKHAIHAEVCGGFLGFGGCETIVSERFNRAFSQAQFSTDLFGMKWSDASHCTKIDSSEEQCESSVSIASDPQRNRIIWGRPSKFLRSYGEWGSEADGPGHFHHPSGVAITHRTDYRHVAFVADKLNNRIVLLVLRHGPLTVGVDWIGTIDGSVSGLPLSEPIDVAWDHAQTWSRADDRLYILDSGHDRVLVYNVNVDPAAGSFSASLLDEFGTSGTSLSQLNRPQGIAVYSYESFQTLYTDIYVSDTTRSAIRVTTRGMT